MKTSVTFLGGAGTVTGSRHLLQINGTQYLIDCGLFQGVRSLRQLNWAPFPVDPSALEAILVTHAHIDHTGYLPRLVREGFHGPILATEATCALLNIMLRDAAHIQEQDAAFANRRGYSRHKPALPLYTTDDAERALSQLRPVQFDDEVEMEGARVRWRPAGHILGSAILEVETPAGDLAFSGDLGRFDSMIMKPPSAVTGGSLVIMESTYGNRLHGDEDVVAILAQAVKYVVDRQGMLLVPAFAVGRTQQVLFHLRRLQDQGVIPDLPIYIDSPMAVDASGIYCQFGDDHNLDVNLLMDEGACPLRCYKTHFVSSVEESKALNEAAGPGVVISASGMCTAGRIRHHLKWRLPQEKNAVLFVGFQAEGTLGRILLEGAGTVRIHGDEVPVAARLFQLHAMSSHADRSDLLRWLSMMSPEPDRVCLVHGEPDVSHALAYEIRQSLGSQVEVPSMMDEVCL